LAAGDRVRVAQVSTAIGPLESGSNPVWSSVQGGKASPQEITMRPIYRVLLGPVAVLIIFFVATAVLKHRHDGTLFAFLDEWLPVVVALIGLCVLKAVADKGRRSKDDAA
jgi:hypothetical protein